MTSLLPQVYEAPATLLVMPAQNQQTNEYDAILIGSRLALTYTQMLTSQPVLQDAIEQLGLDLKLEDLTEQVSAATVRDTQLVRLTVKDSSAERAAQLANTIAQVFSEHVKVQQAERFASSAQMTQEKMGTLEKQIQDTNQEIEAANAQQVEKDAEVAYLNTQLSDTQSNYRILQESYQDAELAMSQVAGVIKIIEEPQITGNTSGYLYTATITLMINQTPGTGRDDYNAILASERIASTLSQTIKSQTVLEATIQQLGLDLETEDLSRRVSVYQVPGTQLIQISAWDYDYDGAKVLTKTVAQAFIDQSQTLIAQPYADRLAGINKQMSELETQIEQTQTAIKEATAGKVRADVEHARLTDLLSGYRSDLQALQQDYDQLNLIAIQTADSVVITEPAQVPNQPIDRRAVNSALAALLGLMAGSGLAFLVEQMIDKIRTKEDINKALGMEALATIGKLESESPELVVGTGFSRVVDDFHVLGTKLRFVGGNDPFKALVVTSPYSSEGKSLILANLALAMARTGLKVTVVDADMRFPRLHQLFQVDQGKGLAGYLRDGVNGKVELSQTKGIRVLTSGEAPGDPTALLNSPNLARLLEKLKSEADVVLIDCPPILPVADAIILSALADGAVLVLRAGQTESHAAREAVADLKQAKAHLAGIVLNDVVHAKDGYYQYYREGGKKPAPSKWTWRRAAETVTRALARVKALIDQRTGSSSILKQR